MKVCLECQIEISCNRKYCSTTCRNKYYHKNTRFNVDYKKSKKREWYLKNRHIELEKVKAYQSLNKEKIALDHNLYMKNRKLIDPSFKIACSIRIRLNKLINSDRVGSGVRDLGCSIEQLKIHLESKFKPGMNWANHGVFGWHIDHIKPLSKFDLTDRAQFLEACNYINLQPLWWYDNLDKGSK